MDETPDINLRVAARDLRYYVFIWDDNILHMPTTIYLERKDDNGKWVPHPVSTSVFAVIRTDAKRYRPENNDWEWACRDFRDIEVDSENIFLRHTREAIDRVVNGEVPAPSFVRFKQALIEGRLFAIVTARGHEPHVIRRAVEYFMEAVLSPGDLARMLANLRGYLESFVTDHGCHTDADVLNFYLSHNRYHGVRSAFFKDLLKRHGTEAASTEDGKQFAIREFVRHVVEIAAERGLNNPISVGFSDDDVLNARAIEDYIRKELGPAFPAVRFVVYYTADPDHPEGRKVEVRGQMNLPF